MDKLEVSPQSVRGYGNIIIPKLSTDFVGKYNEIYTDEDGYFVLAYGGVMLKASATVSNTIKGIQASLTVLVSTRDSDTPVSGLSVDCSVDSVALTGQTTDSTGKCTFTWTPSDLGDSSLLISVTPQDDYAGLSLDKTVTVGLLLGFDGIMTSLSLEDDEVYTGTFEEDVEDRSQLSEFVKDVWVASGGEPIVDEYGIIHICEPGDLVVESEGLEQLPEYSNVLFEEDVDLLTGAVYDMSISEDYEIVLDCLERDDIVPDVPPTPPSYDGITLSSDKNILSYADSDTCTLTAQLTDDGSPVSVEGVTVEFFNGATSLGTSDTNSSGTATLSYSSTGAGDLTLTASVDSIISSEIYVEDCIDYQPLTSNATASRWTIPSGVTSSYSSDGWNISANAYKQVKLTEKLTSACSVEFTLVDYSTPSGYNPSVIVYTYTNGETTPNQAILKNPSSTYIEVLGTQLNQSFVKGAVYRIEYTSSTLKVYENDALLGSATNTVGLPTRFEIHQGANSRYAIYKDIKVKPL